jgi:hypothetical protein
MRQKSELRAYQQRVVDHLYGYDETIAVLRMGAGKTASVLTAMRELIDDKVIRHGLVIAPKRVSRIVWPDEIRAWEHLRGLRYAVLDGGPASRRSVLERADQRDLTIVGIDIAQWLVDELKTFEPDHPLFDLLCVDETSKLKDPKSKRARALRSIAKRFNMRWGMTGTPRPNSAADLFGPAALITDGKLWGNSFYKWRQQHFYATDWQGYDWRPLPGHEAILEHEFATIAITLGEGEMPDLPELSILIDEVKLPPDARQAYDQMERRLFARLDQDTILAKSAAIATGKLAQAANGYMYGEGGNADVSELHSEKADWLAELVESLDGEPLIVVYEYVEDLATIRELFGDVPYLGSGVTDKQAGEWVAAWNRRELPLLALHPASAGHGLNLQAGGSRMAWMAPTWSAELWDQCISRLHRPGQTEHVMVHVCVATNTVDEAKRMRVMDKLSAQAAFEKWLAGRQGKAAA